MKQSRIRASLLPVSKEQAAEIRKGLLEIVCPTCRQREDFTEADCKECPNFMLADAMEKNA